MDNRNYCLVSRALLCKNIKIQLFFSFQFSSTITIKPTAVVSVNCSLPKIWFINGVDNVN